jgi:hypothetical protein
MVKAIAPETVNRLGLREIVIENNEVIGDDVGKYIGWGVTFIDDNTIRIYKRRTRITATGSKQDFKQEIIKLCNVEDLL